jgi:hypothetical protein
MLKVTLTLHDLIHEHADKILEAAAEITAGIREGGGVLPKEKPKKEKPKKENPAPEPVEDEADLSDEEPETEEETVEEEPIEETEAGDVSLESVIDAIKTYVGKNKKGERDKAIALLKKNFKTGNVNKLDEKHYAAAIELFTA